MVIDMSAILNTGKFINAVSIKSITYPLKILSRPLPRAPANISDNAVHNTGFEGFFLRKKTITPIQKTVDIIPRSITWSERILNAAPVFFLYTIFIIPGISICRVLALKAVDINIFDIWSIKIIKKDIKP